MSPFFIIFGFQNYSNMDSAIYSRILDLLQREIKPALGCTEPVAVALCVARAVDTCGSESPIKELRVSVCAGILKNAMGVGIPGTGQTGLPIAIALAAVCGDWHYGLEVFKDVNPKAVRAAKELLKRGIIKVHSDDSPKILYARAECELEDGTSSCCILEDEHDRITFLSRNSQTIFDYRCQTGEEIEEEEGKFLTLEMIYEFARTALLKDLSLIKEQLRLNLELSKEGLKGNYGLRVGKTISSKSSGELFGRSLSTDCMALTAAASDARMAGCPLPAMSNSGSGNQGITVSIPVLAAARSLACSEEEMIRAVTLSNLVAIHIKSYLGRLSALCGCVVASTGSSCGIVMLKGGGVKEMSYAIKNMIGSITGMICDGAKEGCALKVASGVSCALQSAMLAIQGICAQPTDGIIDEDIEKTISNMGKIGSFGMKSTNSLILDIMLCK